MHPRDRPRIGQCLPGPAAGPLHRHAQRRAQHHIVHLNPVGVGPCHQPVQEPRPDDGVQHHEIAAAGISHRCHGQGVDHDRVLGSRIWLPGRDEASPDESPERIALQVSLISLGTAAAGCAAGSGQRALPPPGKPPPVTVYVASYHSNTVTPIDTATNTVLPAIKVGIAPYVLAITP